MGGGLAAEVAGSHAGLVGAVVLLDPVNFALQSANVPRSGVSQYALQSTLWCPYLTCINMYVDTV